jgi:hypothetical protein
VSPIEASSIQCQVRDEAIDRFLWHWFPSRCSLCQRIRVLSQPSTLGTIQQRAVGSRSPTTIEQIQNQVLESLATNNHTNVPFENNLYANFCPWLGGSMRNPTNRMNLFWKQVGKAGCTYFIINSFKSLKVDCVKFLFMGIYLEWDLGTVLLDERSTWELLVLTSPLTGFCLIRKWNCVSPCLIKIMLNYFS